MKRRNICCWLLESIVWACVADAQVITTVVGTDWSFPPTPLPAIHAPLGNVTGVAVDNQGNVYAADGSNNIVVRIATDGMLTVVAGNGLAGYSGDGGPATSASLSPGAIAVDKAGDLYIADGPHFVVRRVTPDGLIATVAGNGMFSGQLSGDGGLATSAELGIPAGLALDDAGDLFIFVNIGFIEASVIRKVATDGTITTVATGLSGSGALAADSVGNLYFPQYGVNVINKLAPNGVISVVANLALGEQGLFGYAIAVDAADNLFVSADVNGLPLAGPPRFVIVKVAPGGIMTLIAGSATPGFSGDGGPATSAQLNFPHGVAVNAADTVYIADTGNSRVRVIPVNGTINTLAGNGNFRYAGDGGNAANAALNSPAGIAFDSAGNLLIADANNNRIRKVTPGGIITTIAGTGSAVSSGDGGPATSASFDTPVSVAVDSRGEIFIVDSFLDLREIDTAGTVTTLSNAATLLSGVPQIPSTAVAVNAAGAIYYGVCSSFNARIDEIKPGSMPVPVVGTGTAGFGDGGPALDAEIGCPVGMAFDSLGNLYFSNNGGITGSTAVGTTAQAVPPSIREVTTNGIISTVACGSLSFTSSTSPASFTSSTSPASPNPCGSVDVSVSSPTALAVDAMENVYFVDSSEVRKLTPNGMTSTVAGNGTPGFAGDGGPAASAELSFGNTSPLCSPLTNGLAVDASGNLYIADSCNNRIREVLAQPPSLQVAPTQLQFIAASGGAPTHPQQITFTASVSGLPFTIQASDTSPWLQVSPPSGVSPRLIAVSADPTTLSPGTYSTTITINSPNGTPSLSEIPVTFTVTAGVPPLLALDKQNLSFFFPQQSSALAQTLKVSNSGGGALSFTAMASTSAGGNWLSVSPMTGQAMPATPVTLTVSADPTGLPPGTYRGSITVSAPGSSPKVVHVTMTISSLDQAILLSQTGLAFLAVAQGGVVPPESFGVLNIGSGVVNWTVSTSTLAGGGWLEVTPANGSTDASASNVPTVQVSVNPAGLAAGQYYGLVRVDAPGAANTPQVLTVFLQVLPAGTDIGAIVQPANLLFTAVAGGESPGSQNLLVYNMVATAKSFQSLVSADPGLNLVTLPTNATLDPQQPASIVVQPFTSGLAAGVYNGAVTLQFSDGRVQSVNAQVIVTAGDSGSPEDAKSRAAESNACTPTKLLPSLTTLGQSFAVSAGWPVWLGVNVEDDCGTPLEAGSVSASFSNGDPTVALQSLKGGYWEGTWPTSNNSLAQVTVTLQAQNPQQQISGKLEVSGALQSPANPPVFPQAGVVSAASFQPYVALAPGGIISIYGNFLAEETASSVPPLLTELPETDTQVFIQGRLAALYYVSQTQINALVPYEVPANTTNQQVLVQRGLTYSLPVAVNVAAAQPAIFNCGGQGCIVAVRNEGSTQVQFLADPATPAQPGDALVIYCAGLGAVTPPVADGYLPGSQLSTIPNSAVQVMIGNEAVPPFFAGLSPRYPGLYQVQVIVPPDVATGSAVPVTLNILGQTSPPLTIAIQ